MFAHLRDRGFFGFGLFVSFLNLRPYRKLHQLYPFLPLPWGWHFSVPLGALNVSMLFFTRKAREEMQSLLLISPDTMGRRLIFQ